MIIKLCFSMANTKVIRGSIFLLLALSLVLMSDRFVAGRRIIETMESKEPVKHNGTVKTIEGKDGDVIDCVDIYQQPAFNHPLLKNHTIEMEPSFIPNVTHTTFNNVELSQGWLENGECPEGTIPIRQAREDEYDVHRAIPQVAHRKNSNTTGLGYDYNRDHEYAGVQLRGGHYYGAHASINVWNPATYNGEISIAQIWLVSGPKDLINTIEAGWLVNARDKQTRFFIYWTRDGYQKTGCYNLDCPGFVQVNRRFVIGSPIKPVSSYNAKQYDIEITIFKNKGNWWLRLQDQLLGYWPHLIYTNLASSATEVAWGGEIYNKAVGGHHTLTQMGSGHFPSAGFGKASYFRNIQYMEYTGKFNDPDQGLVAFATKPSCYSVSVANNKNGGFGTHFYFGGPGYSPICPS